MYIQQIKDGSIHSLLIEGPLIRNKIVCDKKVDSALTID